MKNIISTANNVEWFNNVELDLSMPYSQQQIILKGYASIYSFYETENKNWENCSKEISKDFMGSKNYFLESTRELRKFIQNNKNETIESRLTGGWLHVSSDLKKQARTVFVNNSPITRFLVDVKMNNPDHFLRSKNYFENNLSNSGLGKKGYLVGWLYSYEFDQKDKSEIVKRRTREKATLTKLRNEFIEKLNSCDAQVVNHLAKSNQDIESLKNNIDELKTNKEKELDSLVETKDQEISELISSSKQRLEELKKFYDEELKLKGPADYWRDRANSLKKDGWWAIGVLVLLVLVGTISLYWLLWKTPEGMLLSFFEGDAQAIKWTIVYITFLSFLAYGIRTVHKISFSSFHLARDAEERHHLAYFYLSLRNEKAIEKEDRNLIMQALFSRSDTGLVGPNSNVSMPGEVTKQYITKG